MQPTSLHSLISAVRGDAIGVGSPETVFERVQVDSRQVCPGDVFWALPGSRQDGQRFVGEAFEKGAVAAVVSRRWAAESGEKTVPCIAVDDTLLALHQFATAHRRRSDALVIGVTGSVGKTTTRHLIQSVLSSRCIGVESPHNFNNHVGVPLSLLAIEPSHEYAVLELAAAAIGEIDRLARIVQPEVGVVTAIAPAHLETFGTIENICRAKGELLEALPKTGFAVINGDDQHARRLAQRASCRVLLVGERVSNDIVARNVEVDDGLIRFRVGDAEFALPAIGRHHLAAALIGVAIGREIDLSDDEIAEGLANFTAVDGRCQPLFVGPWIVVDDTYNANPGSMQAACRALRDWQRVNQRILVVGDMLELGHETETYHQQLGATAVVCGVDRLVAVGSQAATIARSAKETGMDAGCLGACRDLDTALALLDCWLEPGDVVFVKGSRGMRMERIIDGLRALAQAREEKPQARQAA
jgi:UDP-N-acetylmuramoyl-tripeptide--D-alanyl-D-alanine ligase